MKKALIIFGSTTGNTEDMSDTIKEALIDSGFETELKDAAVAKPEDLKSEHDVILLGCPAYGHETIELQEDFNELYEQLNGIQLEGKKYACFAPGDSSYEYFCGSVDLLEEKLKEWGGVVVADGLKIDGDPADEKDEIISWAQGVASSI